MPLHCDDCWVLLSGEDEAVSARNKMQEEIERAKAERQEGLPLASSVQREGQHYVLHVATRPGGPAFSDWWESVDDQLVLQAGDFKPDERDRILGVDPWPMIEWARNLYVEGRTPVSCAMRMIGVSRDLASRIDAEFTRPQLASSVESVEHMLALHSPLEDARGRAVECSCGAAWPCPFLRRLRNVRSYRLGHVEHDHPTRVLKDLGAGCAACDATHDIASIDDGVDLVEVLSSRSARLVPQLDSTTFEATDTGRVLVHAGDEGTTEVPRERIGDLVMACMSALTRTPGRW